MDMGRKAIRILNKTEDKVIHADGCVEKAYNFLETGEDDLEINMYGEVVESIPVDWWTGKPIEGMFIKIGRAHV